jgi:hypothetical protein
MLLQGQTPYKSNQCASILFKQSSNHTEENAFIPSSTNSHQNIVPRRYVAPSNRYTDPFVPYVHNTARFPVLPSERRYYSAICHLGKIPGKKRCGFPPHNKTCTSSRIFYTQFNVLFPISFCFTQ